MYDLHSSIVLGFHGCDESIAEQVFAGKTTLRPSQNDYDWLGHGIYFWENNPQRALDYACERQARLELTRGTITKAAVVGAVIDLGRCLSMVDAEHLRLAKDAHSTLVAHVRQAGAAMPKNRRPRGAAEWLLRPLDCAVIETLHRIRRERALPTFDSVRGVFVEGAPLYRGAGFHERTHIQICVRSLVCIRGYFRVLSEPAGVEPGTGDR